MDTKKNPKNFEDSNLPIVFDSLAPGSSKPEGPGAGGGGQEVKKAWKIGILEAFLEYFIRFL